MKYVKKKLIGGIEYYYFNYNIKVRDKINNFSYYLGRILPDNLKESMESFFNKISLSVSKEISSTQNYFFKENIKHIEFSRFNYLLLNHSLFEKELREFRTLFYVLFVLNSNRSEGSKVTQKDVEKIMNKRLKPKSMIGREIINSINAINYSFSSDMKWSAKSIKRIHELLFFDIFPGIAGNYKKVNNVINNSKTTDWTKVSEDMKNLLIWLKKNKKKLYPPELVLEFHWRFEKIHPFEDGNGRVGRIILNALLIELGYAPVIFFSENHSSYCNAINKAILGRKKALAKHYVESVKKSSLAIEKYSKEGKIKGGSSRVGRWEIQKNKIRVW
jgi:Fic family protein